MDTTDIFENVAGHEGQVDSSGGAPPEKCHIHAPVQHSVTALGGYAKQTRPENVGGHKKGPRRKAGVNPKEDENAGQRET